MARNPKLMQPVAAAKEPTDTTNSEPNAVACPGCDGQIFYIPTAQLAPSDYHSGGPALGHIPVEYCAWFRDTPSQQIIAHINVAEFKLKAQ